MAVNRKKLGALLCALLATAVVVSAATASHTSTPGVTKKQITIGGTFPYTGFAALYKTIPAAEQAYYAYVNKHGGVFHRKINDITLDDQYDPSQTPAKTKELGEHKDQIVDAESYNLGDSAQVIAAHEVAMRAKGADTFVVFATPTATIYSLVDKTAIGWSPLTLINNVSANRIFLLAAANASP